MTKEPIFTDKVSAPIGPYSPAVRSNGVIYISGQVGRSPTTGKLVTGGVEAEAKQGFSNFEAILTAAGKGFEDVVRTCVYLTDMNDFTAVNAIYSEHFQKPYPARTCIAVAALPQCARFEIDAIVQD